MNGKYLLDTNIIIALFADEATVKNRLAQTDSAGLDRYAEVPLSTEAIIWANIIFVMEKSHKNKLSKNFQPLLKDKRIICLDIPDEYEYMEPALIELLKQKVLPLLKIKK